ncbi:DNA alkylation repair protein [Leptospira gomenensis]|uniref:DNA alkylation repair protein n=1 Tax=Leptospira gomenensis TaxID=2484974 RepID=A0A5F1YDQ2_9LEPT|nr:DNA alkylation repair protein [Leptospira gomenensis]TGK36382.1 DNA alkylation repair protein [Leptospira gomenensis]TGK42029.1 DNA alkylation repair protein [Leptospira gomenensis]TGK48888.1 DNA alkylation repair protein [Leptospira gomenensis]TGK58013.1 DNA alkylation repair protein [Leptospira gomenensis]
MPTEKRTQNATSAADVQKELCSLSDPIKADFLAGFFKTGPGQYAEGDVFIGVVVPKQRKIARKFRDLPLEEIRILLNSPVHEERLTSLLILCDRFSKATPQEKKRIHRFYLDNLKRVNNWDLVDLSSRVLIGEYLRDKDRKILDRLAKSKRMWDRRIAIVSTYALIVAGEFEDTIRIAEILLSDKEDLIHKATGWMLREVADRDRTTTLLFLDKHADRMPRTMLRYTIEKFPDSLKRKYMASGTSKDAPKKKIGSVASNPRKKRSH